MSLSESIDFERVRRFCLAREVDLQLTGGPERGSLRLDAEFDLYGAFFSVVVVGVEYIDCPGVITVGDLLLTHDMNLVSGLVPKWNPIRPHYSGTALVIRSADLNEWNASNPSAYAVIVANSISFLAGPDWDDPGQAEPATRW
jgi:hypothetical protein